MKVFGYENNDDKMICLEEVSIQCTLDELKEICDFFDYVYKQHFLVKSETEFCHSHFKDWSKERKETDADVIIVTKF